MGQIQTVGSIVAAISALLMGAWSVKFNQKSLLVLGLFFVNVAIVGCFLASNFSFMVLSFSVSRLGYAMVAPILYALVGRLFPLEQRPRAIGWLLTGASLSYILGAPFIGIIARFGGWRLSVLGLLPITLLSFYMAVREIPSIAPSVSNSSKNDGTYWEGFYSIFTNRSAISCLLGAALSMAGWQMIVFYAPSFFREQFMISLEFASLLIFGESIFGMVGIQIGGHIVSKFGRKRITILTAILAGFFNIFFTNVPNLWWALMLMFLGSLFTGMMFTATASLALEQVSSFQGSMMSVSAAADNLGAALGAGIGGMFLLWRDYETVGIVLGILSLLAAIVYYFFVQDTTDVIPEH